MAIVCLQVSLFVTLRAAVDVIIIRGHEIDVLVDLMKVKAEAATLFEITLVFRILILALGWDVA